MTDETEKLLKRPTRQSGPTSEFSLVRSQPQFQQRKETFVRSRSAEACYQAAQNWFPYVMRCKNPYVNSTLQAYGCGQCMPCRINKRREWAHRIMLEASLHVDSSFITLTYKPGDNCPKSLVPSHARDWLKRIRKATEPVKLRYFLVGEYGDSSWRPHYHIALFSYPACRFGFTRYTRTKGASECCDRCKLVQSTWSNGNIYIGRLEPESAAYIAGYVTKKMTSRDDERLEDDRHPEFMRCSLKPGIGADAMWDISSTVLEHASKEPDVPTALLHERRARPLGRYLTRKLREYSGRDPSAPEVTIAKAQEKLQDLRDDTKRVFSDRSGHSLRRFYLKKRIQDRYQGKVAQIEARTKIYAKRRNKV